MAGEVNAYLKDVDGTAVGTSGNPLNVTMTDVTLEADISGLAKSLDQGTATAGGASTLSDTSKAWAVNMWSGYSVRLTAGTGIGQARVIATNTASVLTVGSAWATQPATGSTKYEIIDGSSSLLYTIDTVLDTISTNTGKTAGMSTVPVAILVDTATSSEVEIGGYKYMSLFMPATWTAANLTFQAATASGGTFYDLYDDAGNEVTVIAAGARAISVDMYAFNFAPIRYIKFRSGTAATPVNQTAAKTITVILKQ